jgi:hypothetical protein
MAELLERYTVAMRELGRLKPAIYSAEHVERNIRAANTTRMPASQFIGFVVAAENNVKRTRARLARPADMLD